MATQVEGVKWVPGTDFLVDAFRFQNPRCRHYFLTHAHSDHTTGLSRAFRGGTIYCSRVTAALVAHDVGLPPGAVVTLDVGEALVVDGVTVAAFDANHCPGAIMLLFTIPGRDGAPPTTVLHTGDCRWDAAAAAPAAAAVAALPRGLDVLMLDTTYCAPRWAFPPQADAVAALAALMRAEAAATPPGGAPPLFVVSCYRIGKERAVFGAAAALGWRVYAPPAKRRVLDLLGLPPAWTALLADSPDDAPVHMHGGPGMQEAALAAAYLDPPGARWGRVVFFRATGWSHRRGRGADAAVGARGGGGGRVVFASVPYSEHSSFTELQDCVKTLRPRRIVPTVNAGDAAAARALVDLLVDGMDLSADRSRLDRYLRPRPRAAPVEEEMARGVEVEEAAPAAAGQDVEVEVEDAAPAAAPGPEALALALPVDLAAVDVEGQRRALEEIGRRRRLAAQRAPAPGGGGSGIRRFLVPRPPGS